MSACSRLQTWGVLFQRGKNSFDFNFISVDTFAVRPNGWTKRGENAFNKTITISFHWLWWPNFQTALPLWILNRWIVRHKQTYVNCKWSDSLSFSCPFGRSLIFRNFSCQFQVKLLLLWFFLDFKYKILAFFSLFKHNVYFIHAITWTMCSIARRTLIFRVCARTLLINFQWPLSLSLFEWRQWPVKM